MEGWRKTICRKSKLRVTEDSKEKQPKAMSQKEVRRRNVSRLTPWALPVSLQRRLQLWASQLAVHLHLHPPLDSWNSVAMSHVTVG